MDYEDGTAGGWDGGIRGGGERAGVNDREIGQGAQTG